ncbi:MAG TPA: hydrogenase expression/formation protein HypE [Firmicutes bacterium]|jgi:hydrogenase expression/formation protein HypE|nr:hydrogenase expression/formation protein HypE [Bacillota bacterium]
MADRIRLAEGGGGEATAELIQRVFWSRLQYPELLKGNDASIIEIPGNLSYNSSQGFVSPGGEAVHKETSRIAVTTDSFVVTPWRFPGGDIGRLAICGTVNDLTMMGAEILGLTTGFIIEEGFSVRDLEQIVQSLADTAVEAGVKVVAGDTKVVNKGAADGIYINTTGIGWVDPLIHLGGELARPGDQVIVTGTMGDHGAAILLARGELGIQGELQSDVAPLNHLLKPLIQKFPGQIRVLRDPTRGGLATTLNEIARQSSVSIHLEEEKIPVKPQVQGICALLGLDPFYLANEGKAIIICGECIGEDLLRLLHQHPFGTAATVIGKVASANPGLVSVRTGMGGERILPMGSGEQLPRIC